MTMMNNRRGVLLFKRIALSSVASAALAVGVWSGADAQPAAAQASGQNAEQGASVLLQEVVVTATKRVGVAVQDVPLAVTAYNQKQIETLKIHGFQDLSVSMPNVELQPLGAT